MKPTVDPKVRLPPGPKGRALRNLRRRLTDYPGFLDALHDEYGHVVSYELPKLKCCALSDPELVHEVLVAQEPAFRPWYPRAKHDFIRYDCLARSHGDEHRRLRRLMLAAFAEDRLPGYARIIIEEAHTLRERCRREQSVDIKAELERYTWSCLLDSVLGSDLEAEPSLGKDVLDAMKKDIMLSLTPVGQVLKKLPLPHNANARRVVAALDEVTYRAIGRAADPYHDGDDVITFFVRAAAEGAVDWSFDDDRAIRDEAYTLLFGAVDAPVGALAHAVHLLEQRPTVRRRVEEEVDSVLGEQPVAFEDLNRLPYVNAVFKEILRIEPPAYVMLPREALEDCVLGNFLVPKGTLVHVSTRAMHRRPDRWNRAGEFRPERWLEEQPPDEVGCPAHGYIPFSAEPRGCRGAEFARMLFVFAIATLTQRLRLRPATEAPPATVNLGVGVKGPIPVSIASRQPSSIRRTPPPPLSPPALTEFKP